MTFVADNADDHSKRTRKGTLISGRTGENVSVGSRLTKCAEYREIR